jgi:tetratricopeptide (TPR) repeat protein
MTPTPLIQWNEVPDATEYTVRVLGPDGIVWETRTGESEIRYSGRPPLEAGVSYAIEVMANTGVSSTDEGIPGLAFSIINELSALEIIANSELLRQQEAPSMTEVYLLAEYYKQQELAAKAINTIEEFIEQETVQSPAIYRFLGDLYLDVGLTRHAKDAYLKVLDLTKDNNDMEEKAVALSALSRIHIALNNPEEAVRYFNEAQNLYVALDGKYSENAEAIRHYLMELGL